MAEIENMDAVLRRIEKLLALSRDGRGNSNEAAAAAAMAARVMKKHQLSEADVVIAKMKAGDELERAFVIPTLAEWKEPLKRVPRWASLLATQIGALTETRPSITFTRTDKGQEVCICFEGFSPDVKLAVYMLMYLQGEFRRFRAEFVTTYTYKTVGFSALRSYTDGLTMGTIGVLQDEINAMAEEAAAAMTASTSTALVVAKAAAIAERFGPRAEGKKVKIMPRQGYSAGLRDGQSISIKKAIETTPGSTQDSPTTLMIG